MTQVPPGVRSRCIRKSTGVRPAKRAATRGNGSPNRSAQSAAVNAFRTASSPGIGRVATASSSPQTSRSPVAPSGIASTSACSSAPDPIPPHVTTATPASPHNARPAAKSPGITTSRHPRNRRTFSRCSASELAKCSRCASPRWVRQPMSGRTQSASRAISPGWEIPTSMRAQRWWGRMPKRATGTPIWLLKLRGLRWMPSPSRWASHSLTTVLPLLPVSASTGTPAASRQTEAQACAAAMGSAATTTSESGRRWGPGSWATMNRRIPAAWASVRWSWPSCQVPRMARNTASTAVDRASSVRVSKTSSRCPPAAGPSRRPPQRAAHWRHTSGLIPPFRRSVRRGGAPRRRPVG